MIAEWMLYCAAVGLLFSAGAAALEKAVRALGRPTRWVWTGAMALTLVVPAAARFAPAPRPAVHAAAPARAEGRAITLDARTVPLPAPRFDPAAWDGALGLAWGASSAAAALAIVAMTGALLVRRRRWAAARVDGVPVLVSDDTGPAVIGLLRCRIVLPRWALASGDDARRLVIEHEQEHVRAGDPRLLAAGLAAAVITPWNPAVWWQLARLRLAVEVDCDARVLRRRADLAAYGAVLIEVGRRTARTRLPAAAFAEPVSSLERRIRIMTAPRVRRPLLRAAGFGALAAALAAAACEAPQPLQPSVSGSRTAYAAPDAPADLLRSSESMAALVRRYFPDVAKHGLPADQTLAFTFAPNGQVAGHEILRTPQRPAGEASGGHHEMITVRAGGDTPSPINQIDPSRIATVDVEKLPAGQLAPTPVAVILIRLKAPGSADASRVSRRETEETVDGSGRTTRVRMTQLPGGTVVSAADVVAGDPGAAGGVDETALRAAVQRFYTPEMKAAGVAGQVRMEFTVGADGKAQDVTVTATNPALEPVGRSIVQSLTFPAAPGGRRVIALGFGERARAADGTR